MTMLKPFLVAVVLLAACSSSKAAPSPRNLVVDSVHDLDPEIRCTAMLNGEGPLVMHTARCKLTDKTWAYCRISSESRMLECGPLYNTPPPRPAEVAATTKDPSSSAPVTPAQAPTPPVTPPAPVPPVASPIAPTPPPKVPTP